MSNLSLSDEIRRVVESYSTNTQPSERCIIIRGKGEGYADIKLLKNNQILLNVPVVGEALMGDNALLVYVTNTNPVVLCSPTGITQNTILALALGLFHINDEGHLIVELPNTSENIFEINENGHLLVTLPTGASNDYNLNTTDKHLYYEREDY